MIFLLSGEESLVLNSQYFYVCIAQHYLLNDALITVKKKVEIKTLTHEKSDIFKFFYIYRVQN